MAKYYRAPSLDKLVAQVNAMWPGRDKASDGWIGDPSHQARKSDHNPDYTFGWNGVVRAQDLDKDGIDVSTLLRAVTTDSRTAYVIWNGQIWTPARGWYKYTGPNPHKAHIHVSIKHTKAAELDYAWDLGPQKKGLFMYLTEAQEQAIYNALVGPNGSTALNGLMPNGQNLATSLWALRTSFQKVADDLAPVERVDPRTGKVVKVPLRQEIADVKTAQAAQDGKIAGLLEAIKQVGGGDIDLDAIEAAAERGASRGVINAVDNIEKTTTINLKDAA